ncbi:hypothetical protein ACNKU7_18720 [Microbulbifer sp. SA54]|uniref:hypothetical protein n=1 Tax=Microbulbifer sp. SA54 TaxID=3401577 RepID=UPI003AAF5E2E
MTEREFIESIDFGFPYEDKEKSMDLIAKGRAISANASFMVLHEIVRAPNEVAQETKESLYHCWRNGFSHDLLDPVKEAAEALLANKFISVTRAIGLMCEIEKYINQYCALSIVYFSCDDTEGLADQKYNEIIEQWQSA